MRGYKLKGREKLKAEDEAEDRGEVMCSPDS